ncbi:MAG: phosphoribosylaminoimidazolesuccinocarboxamide synthase [Armatimonadota bacterium]|nr:MAG: phosphoribosylaminoimidazolesuccinocarboxamide synthase [Armatimonadota bacterium]
MAERLLRTEFEGVELLGRGKVRDIYDLGSQLLIVATDRISAFDVVMPNGIPDKGRVLTQMSLFWFELTQDIVENHLLTADATEYPACIGKYLETLAGRSMLVKRAEVVPVECVARGYLAGSGWKEYREKGTVCGIELPAGLRESDELPEPIFTPATKAESGHDINITPEQAMEIAGEDTYRELERLSLAVYGRAADYARERGIIIADTKFEFGRHGNRLILIDEVLTPDSSRFWPADEYEPGRPQRSFDKQPVRDYLESTGWDKRPPAPELPAEVVEGTSERYREALRLLTGRELEG